MELFFVFFSFYVSFSPSFSWFFFTAFFNLILDGLDSTSDPTYPTPPLGQDMTQGQFLSGVLTGLNSEFSFF